MLSHCIRYVACELGESHDIICCLFALKIDCSLKDVRSHQHILLKHHSLSQMRHKPSLGNCNMHQRGSLDTEPSASEILHDKYSSFCFMYVSRVLMSVLILSDWFVYVGEKSNSVWSFSCHHIDSKSQTAAGGKLFSLVTKKCGM